MGPVPAPVTTQELPVTVAAPVANRALPVTPLGAVASKKLAGQLTVIFWDDVSAVARVKLTVTVWEAAAGRRLEGVIETKVTWPPRADTVLLEATLLMSFVSKPKKRRRKAELAGWVPW